MIKLNKSKIQDTREKIKGMKIAVVGDLMLDCYIIGKINRISPEAPVPVLEMEKEFHRFGGAANVALNLSKLGANPLLIGVIGNDEKGSIFNSILAESGISSEGLLVDDERATTAKTRIIAGNHHVVRIDKEVKDYLSKIQEVKIINYLSENINSLNGIILQDYNKGVLTPDLIHKIIELANENGIIVNVDPKFLNFFEYKNVTCFKPNRKETEDALRMLLKNEDDLIRAGNQLLERIKAKYVLLTLGEQGVALFDKDGVKKIPTKARKVADVSGAGDTVISTLTVAMAAGLEPIEASYLANYAGGLVCEEVGIVPIEADKLFDELCNESVNA